MNSSVIMVESDARFVVPRIGVLHCSITSVPFFLGRIGNFAIGRAFFTLHLQFDGAQNPSHNVPVMIASGGVINEILDTLYDVFC